MAKDFREKQLKEKMKKVDFIKAQLKKGQGRGEIAKVLKEKFDYGSLAAARQFVYDWAPAGSTAHKDRALKREAAKRRNGNGKAKGKKPVKAAKVSTAPKVAKPSKLPRKPRGFKEKAMAEVGVPVKPTVKRAAEKLVNARPKKDPTSAAMRAAEKLARSSSSSTGDFGYNNGGD
jgi:hypothetical protein